MKKTKMKEGWVKLGKVGVDSGQLVVSDPCYIDSEWVDEDYTRGKPQHKFSYNACCDKTISNNYGQLKYKLGHDGVGVVFNTGFGDGCYDVYGYFKNYGTTIHPDWRISQVRIDLITEKELDMVRKMGMIK